MFGGYQSFKFSTALISEIYSTTAQDRMQADNVPENKEQAKMDMAQCLESRGRY